MATKEIKRTDIRYLDGILFDERQRVRPLLASQLRVFPHDDIIQWCTYNARYSLPTVELVAFLHGLIGDRHAIELGAGMGDLGYALGIPMTDSFCQVKYLKAIYSAMNAAPTDPPPDVRELEAERAIAKWKPRVAIAAWLTQKYQLGDEGPPPINSSVFGPDEISIINNVECYVHIGNFDVHGDKRALKLPHRVLTPPWLVSRGFDQSKNCIYLWGA